MPSDLNVRVDQLAGSLEEFDTKDTAPAPVAEVFNALLGEAQKQDPADPVLSSIGPVEIGGEFALIDCGALRALVQQLRVALDG